MKVERCLLAFYPTGQLSAENFRFDDSTDIDLADTSVLPDGQVLVKLLYISVDPYMRGRFKPGSGYIVPGFEIGKPIESYCVAEVVESKHETFPKTTRLVGVLPWETHQVISDPSARGLQPIPAELAGSVPPSYFLGVLGMTGLSAYLPFLKFSQDFLNKKKKRDGSGPPVVFVSGAAGAVGSVFGQLCKNENCTVYGSAGSDDKIELCKSKFGFDNAFNYKSGTIAQGLDAVLNGQTIDLYFDNVGGPMLDAVLQRMSTGGKIICCGSISQYDVPEQERYGIQNIFCITTKCLTLHGFLLFQWITELPQATIDLAKMLQENKIYSEETVLKGFDKVVDGMLGILQGTNVGKMIIEV
jgi:NADPH:quinone reductase